jgi:hypothetical protein
MGSPPTAETVRGREQPMPRYLPRIEWARPGAHCWRCRTPLRALEEAAYGHGRLWCRPCADAADQLRFLFADSAALRAARTMTTTGVG